eukprot:g16010.t1
MCGDQCNENLHRIKQIGFGISETQLGFLQSSFMIGFSIAALFFGHAVHLFKPFRLISIGLGFWSIAAFLSGYSGILCKQQQAASDFDVTNVCSGFYLMVFARILSGFGEASFATISVPFLDDVVDKKHIGLYLAVYFSAVPCGTALGFMWGGEISSVLGWEYAFLIEAPLMLPAVIYFFFVPHTLSSTDVAKKAKYGDSRGSGSSEALLVSETYEERQSNRHGSHGDSSGSYTSSDESLELIVPKNGNYKRSQRHGKNSVLDEVKILVCNPVYMLTCIGYSAFTAVTAGFAFYAPTFVQRNNPCLNVEGPCKNEWHFSQKSADLIFGIVVASSGLFGTALGGKIMDCCGRKKETSDEEESLSGMEVDSMAAGLQRCKTALAQLTWESTLATIICVVAMQSSSPFMFFSGIWVGCLVLFTTTSAVNGVLLWSVPVENRAMSMGFSVLILHAFGDVPSPVIIGYIDDTWKNPRFTMSVTSLWLTVCIGTWFLSYLVIRNKWCRSASKTKRAGEELLVVHEEET